MIHRVKVADKKQRLLLVFAPAQEHDHALLLVAAVDPLESFRRIILLIESRMLQIQLVEGFYIGLHIFVKRVFQKIPLQGRVFIPLINLAVLLSHKQKLLSRMADHKSVSCTEIFRLLLQGIPRHLAHHGAFAVHHLIVGEHQHKVLAVGVEHGECQLAVVVIAEIGVALHIAEEVVHPAHIPLVVKAQAPVCRLSGNHGPRCRFLGDQDSPVLSPLKDRVEMLQELHSLQVLIAAVNICHPLPIILPVVKVKHGSNRIHANSVRMILVRPEQSICNEEIRHSGTSIIVNQGSPVGMRSLPGILMLVYTGSVKSSQAVGIPRKMSRHPIKDHADSLLVHVIHEGHKIIRGAVTAGRRVIARYLVAPGSIQRMLHHRHQLHMGISHLLHIGCQLFGNLPVIIKFGACNRISLLVHGNIFAHPGAQMHLIDIHGLVLCIGLCPARHPLLILPLVTADIPDNRSRVGAQLRVIGIGIRLQHGLAMARLDFILIDISLLQPGDKQFKNAGVVPAHSAHLVTPSVPLVKISYHADAHGTGCPYGKIHALHPVNRHGMGAHFFIDGIVNAGSKFLYILVRVQRCKGIGVVNLLLSAALVLHKKRVGRHALSRNQHRKKSRLIRHLHGVFLSIAREFYRNGHCCGDKCLNEQSILRHMRPQELMGIGSLRVNQLLNPCPVHLIVQFLFHQFIPPDFPYTSGLERAGPLLNVLFEIDNVVLILLFHERGGDHKVRACLVVGNGDVVYLSNPQKGLHIRVMGLRRKRVGKENDEINLSLHNLRADLLVSPQRTAVVSLYRQSRVIRNHAGRRPRTAEKMP